MEAPAVSAPRRTVAVSRRGLALTRSTVVATLVATVAGLGLQLAAVRQDQIVMPAGLLAGAFPALSLLIRDGVDAVVPSLAAAGVAVVVWLPFVLLGVTKWGSVAITVAYPLTALAWAAASERLRVTREGPALPATD